MFANSFLNILTKKPPFPFHPHPLTLKTLILTHLSVQYLALDENTLHPHLFMVPLPLPDAGYRRTVATPILSLQFIERTKWMKMIGTQRRENPFQPELMETNSHVERQVSQAFRDKWDFIGWEVKEGAYQVRVPRGQAGACVGLVSA